MSQRRVAVFGDVHNSLSNLKLLYARLEHESLDAIYTLGDLIDRGPDPAGVLAFCREKKIDGVIGNHDHALLHKHILTGKPPKHHDKLWSYEAVLLDPANIQYLESLKKIMVLEEHEAILVHAGVDPLKPLAEQNQMCAYLDMVNPKHLGESRWSGVDRQGRFESENRRDGWRPWHELYDFPYDVYQGHLTVSEPTIMRLPNGRVRTLTDTGAYWSGVLTAAIIQGPGGAHRFIQTPRLKVHQKHVTPLRHVVRIPEPCPKCLSTKPRDLHYGFFRKLMRKVLGVYETCADCGHIVTGTEEH